jgi:hypothetical protein
MKKIIRAVKAALGIANDGHGTHTWNIYHQL